MFDQIVFSVSLVFGVVFAEFICLKAFGKQDSGLANLFELVLIIGLVSFVSQVVFVSSSFFVMVFVVFFTGFIPALLVKTVLHLYYRRFHSERFLAKKSMIVQLVRSMRVEGVSKVKMKKIFSRLKIDVINYLDMF
jgi:uncharacterized membrane protein YcaP (DUF421 family)